MPEMQLNQKILESYKNELSLLEIIQRQYGLNEAQAMRATILSVVLSIFEPAIEEKKNV